MRTWMSEAAAAAGTFAVIGIGTPVLATLITPVVFPVVVAAAAAYALRRGER